MAPWDKYKNDKRKAQDNRMRIESGATAYLQKTRSRPSAKLRVTRRRESEDVFEHKHVFSAAKAHNHHRKPSMPRMPWDKEESQ